MMRGPGTAAMRALLLELDGSCRRCEACTRALSPRSRTCLCGHRNPPPAAKTGKRCASCGRTGVRLYFSRNLCGTCYNQATASGTLDDYPPARLTLADRREDYHFLRDQGLSPAEAAPRVGITLQTALRYYETDRSS
jgi:hypothetical protein